MEFEEFLYVTHHMISLYLVDAVKPFGTDYVDEILIVKLWGIRLSCKISTTYKYFLYFL